MKFIPLALLLLSSPAMAGGPRIRYQDLRVTIQTTKHTVITNPIRDMLLKTFVTEMNIVKSMFLVIHEKSPGLCEDVQRKS